jgi:hypothetical protein
MKALTLLTAGSLFMALKTRLMNITWREEAVATPGSSSFLYRAQ